MRGLFNQVSRGVVTLAVIVALAAPVQARPREDERGLPSKFLKAIKSFVVKTFGDGIIVPRP